VDAKARQLGPPEPAVGEDEHGESAVARVVGELVDLLGGQVTPSPLVQRGQVDAVAGDRGFGMSGPPLADLWADLTLERLEADVRSTVLPDNDDTQDKHDWEWLAECLRNSGVQVSPHDHQGLPYDVAFSERLRARIVG
jgi:hypothetical protein